MSLESLSISGLPGLPDGATMQSLEKTALARASECVILLAEEIFFGTTCFLEVRT